MNQNQTSPNKKKSFLPLLFLSLGVIGIVCLVIFLREDETAETFESEKPSEIKVAEEPTEEIPAEVQPKEVPDETVDEVVDEIVPVIEEKPVEEKLPKLTKPRAPEPQILRYDEMNKKYVIEYPPYKNAETYFIEIFSDPELQKPVETFTSNQERVMWGAMRSGRYYFRYKVRDIWGRVTVYSEPGELIFPISPMIDL